jgi:hypothetical protein
VKFSILLEQCVGRCLLSEIHLIIHHFQVISCLYFNVYSSSRDQTQERLTTGPTLTTRPERLIFKMSLVQSQLLTLVLK